MPETAQEITVLSLLNDAKVGKSIYCLAKESGSSDPILENYNRAGEYKGVSSVDGAHSLRIPGPFKIRQTDIQTLFGHFGLNATVEQTKSEEILKPLAVAMVSNERNTPDSGVGVFLGPIMLDTARKTPEQLSPYIEIKTAGDEEKNRKAREIFKAMETLRNFLKGPMIYRTADGSFPIFLGFRGGDPKAKIVEELSLKTQYIQRQFRALGVEMVASEQTPIADGTAPVDESAQGYYNHINATFRPKDMGNAEKLKALLGRIDALEQGFSGPKPEGR